MLVLTVLYDFKMAVESGNLTFVSCNFGLKSYLWFQIELALGARPILKSCVWFQTTLHSTQFNYRYVFCIIVFSWKVSDSYQFSLFLLLLLLFMIFFLFPSFVLSFFFVQILNRLSLLARESHSLLKQQIETCAQQTTDFKVGNAWYP